MGYSDDEILSFDKVLLETEKVKKQMEECEVAGSSMLYSIPEKVKNNAYWFKTVWGEDKDKKKFEMTEQIKKGIIKKETGFELTEEEKRIKEEEKIQNKKQERKESRKQQEEEAEPKREERKKRREENKKETSEETFQAIQKMLNFDEYKEKERKKKEEERKRKKELGTEERKKRKEEGRETEEDKREEKNEEETFQALQEMLKPVEEKEAEAKRKERKRKKELGSEERKKRKEEGRETKADKQEERNEEEAFGNFRSLMNPKNNDKAYSEYNYYENTEKTDNDSKKEEEKEEKKDKYSRYDEEEEEKIDQKTKDEQKLLAAAFYNLLRKGGKKANNLLNKLRETYKVSKEATDKLSRYQILKSQTEEDLVNFLVNELLIKQENHPIIKEIQATKEYKESLSVLEEGEKADLEKFEEQFSEIENDNSENTETYDESYNGEPIKIENIEEVENDADANEKIERARKIRSNPYGIATKSAAGELVKLITDLGANSSKFKTFFKTSPLDDLLRKIKSINSTKNKDMYFKNETDPKNNVVSLTKDELESLDKNYAIQKKKNEIIPQNAVKLVSKFLYTDQIEQAIRQTLTDMYYSSKKNPGFNDEKTLNTARCLVTLLRQSYLPTNYDYSFQYDILSKIISQKEGKKNVTSASVKSGNFKFVSLLVYRMKRDIEKISDKSLKESFNKMYNKLGLEKTYLERIEHLDLYADKIYGKIREDIDKIAGIFDLLYGLNQKAGSKYAIKVDNFDARFRNKFVKSIKESKQIGDILNYLIKQYKKEDERFHNYDHIRKYFNDLKKSKKEDNFDDD